MHHTDEQRSGRATRIRTVTRYLARYRWYLTIGGVAVVATNVLMLIVPYITKIIFDKLQAGEPASEILNLVLLSIALAVVAGGFRFALRRTIIWMSRWVEYHLRGDLFSHLLRLSPSFYHETRTGDVMARATNDLEAVRMMIGPGVMHIGNTIVTVIVAMTFMISLEPTLTLYAVAPAVVFPFVVNRVGNLIHKRFARIQEHFARLTATAQENLAGVRVVKAYRQEPAETESFRLMSRRYLGLNMDLARVHALFIPMLFFLSSLLNLMVLYFGGVRVIEGTIPLGTMVAFFAYLGMLFWPMFALGWVISLYQRGVASLDRINAILRTEPAVSNTVAGAHKAKMEGHLEFRNLRFSYDGHPVLDGITLTVEPGQTVGLVGPTGCGKTTLVSLLVRLFPVSRGQVFVDGRDINDWDLTSLRQQIGFATQEPFLFSDTIADNIRLGIPGATEQEVAVAAETAALSKDIEMFPAKYETMVGERGITLSGGQKQRAAIARAILTEPVVLILDDATSSVDSETESEITHRIRAVLSRRTAIVISHRVSSVKEADIVCYFENGRIVQRGSHDELIRMDGAYAALYRAQLLEEELEKL